ncbi:unnamed protein product [Schistosoma margrebowiei]|uniref:Uncharacterized protein n=1 Tax=Schistosoma margrebowiei TaxID=48269 RepID=A0A183LD22_9TREM|nr:unnamed protein product [Schistosoma margrebowiei]
MWETRNTSQIATEIRRYNLAILGISETHWTQARQQRLNTGEMLLYSAREEENVPHTQRVSLMLSNVARNTLVGWESHGSRIIKASFKTKKEGILMNIIQCYAPTNDSNDDIKDQFYERLTGQTAIQTFNTAFLRDTDRLNEFKIALNNRFQALQDLLKGETTMEDNWKSIKEALTSTCQEVLGLKKHHQKEWISIETLDKIKERKNKKAAINNNRTRAEKVQA